MDNLTHTLFAVTLARTPLGRAGRGATAALILASNAPDIDIPARYITGGSGADVRGPGPQIEGARWLSSRRVFAAGSDTIAFERVPDSSMPVHVHLLVESGIHLVEALNLEELARDGVHSFWFVAAPLKIRGGTGAPVRPLALKVD
jgi:kynurenine formamidase